MIMDINNINEDQEPVRLVDEPSHLDILCGKTKACMLHAGTKRFRLVIESYRERYAQALTKYDKMTVTKEIYDCLANASSRFLKYNEDVCAWEELSSLAARDKVGHALRFANRETRRGGKRSRSSSPLTATSVVACENSIMVPPPPPPPLSPQSVATLSFPTLFGDDDDSSSCMQKKAPAFEPLLSFVQQKEEQPEVVAYASVVACSSTTMENTLKLIGETVALLNRVSQASQSDNWGISSPCCYGDEVLAQLAPRTEQDVSGTWDFQFDTDISPAIFA